MALELSGVAYESFLRVPCGRRCQHWKKRRKRKIGFPSFVDPLTDSQGLVGSARGNQGTKWIPADGTNAGDGVVNRDPGHINRARRESSGPTVGIILILRPERTHTCERRRRARLWCQSRPAVERR